MTELVQETEGNLFMEVRFVVGVYTLHQETEHTIQSHSMMKLTRDYVSRIVG